MGGWPRDTYLANFAEIFSRNSPTIPMPRRLQEVHFVAVNLNQFANKITNGIKRAERGARELIEFIGISCV